MKKYKPEITTLILQSLVFYLIPLLMKFLDPLIVMLIIFLSTLFLAIHLAMESSSNLRFLSPIVVAILFSPTIFIYYNESAAIYSRWFFEIYLFVIVAYEIIKVIKHKIYN